MSDDSLLYEILERPDPEGGLVLDLIVEGERVATARAGHEVLSQMRETLGMERAAVAMELRTALREHLKRPLQKVLALSLPREIPPVPPLHQ